MSHWENQEIQKIVGATKRKSPEDKWSILKGTTFGYYMWFIQDTLDIMDEFPGLKGFYIIMNNAPVHILEIVVPIIIRRGYTPVYLTSYSPELNPIEQFWAVVKAKFKRGKLNDVEALIIRIVEACDAAPDQQFVKWFNSCLNKVSLHRLLSL